VARALGKGQAGGVGKPSRIVRLLVREDIARQLGGGRCHGDRQRADRLRAVFRIGTRAHRTQAVLRVSMRPPELVVFGAGSDAEPLARQAWDLGFSVAVVDAREAFLAAERFPHAKLICAHFSRFGESVPLTEQSFVVIMNHHLERDRESLRFAVESAAAYIGVLGPRSRYARLLGLREEGYVRTRRSCRVRNRRSRAGRTPGGICRFWAILALQRSSTAGSSTDAKRPFIVLPAFFSLAINGSVLSSQKQIGRGISGESSPPARSRHIGRPHPESARVGAIARLAITALIGRQTGGALLVEEGTLYPALWRLEGRGFVEAEWGLSDNNRKAKFYRLTATGRRRLRDDTRAWETYASAVNKMLRATAAPAESA
jgi:hypothetical protein